MLDTNVCIAIIKHASNNVIKHLKELEPESIGISSISLAELRFGCSKSQFPMQNHQALDQFILPLAVANFDEQAAIAYGALRTELENKGTPIGPLDTLIGAHAMSLEATLVTNNSREFARINQLRLEDWTR